MKGFRKKFRIFFQKKNSEIPPFFFTLKKQTNKQPGMFVVSSFSATTAGGGGKRSVFCSSFSSSSSSSAVLGGGTTRSFFLRSSLRRGSKKTNTNTTTKTYTRLLTRCEIRTTRGKEQAKQILGLTAKEARDERKLKKAYRRNALRTHPDTGGRSASAEAFREVQKAYRLLRLDLVEGGGAGGKNFENNDEVDESNFLDDDLEGKWEEHDWRWKAKYEKQNKSVSSEQKREELFKRVRALKHPHNNTSTSNISSNNNVNTTNNININNKKKKRKIRPVGQQTSPKENFRCVQEAEKRLKEKQEEAMRKKVNFKAVGGPDASRHSTNAAHDTINSQLDGLRRKQVLKSRYGGDYDDEDTRIEKEKQREAARRVRRYQLELEDSEEERFMRLAKMAKEWRNKKGGVLTWRDTGSTTDADKMSPRELLLAAVESVAIGAHQ